MLCADLVGPQGTVVGSTRTRASSSSPHRVQATGWRNVEFRQGDIWDVDLPHDFDAIVGRWVLMYVEEPGRSCVRSPPTSVRAGS